LSLTSTLSVHNQKKGFFSTAANVLSSIVKNSSTVNNTIAAVNNTISSVITGGLSSSSASSGLASSVKSDDSSAAGASIFDLIGSSSANSWTVNGGTRVIQGTFPLGVLSGSAVASKIYSFTQSFQSVAIRFRVHMVGTWTGQTLWVKVNGALVYTTQLYGSDTYTDIQIQVPCSE